MIIISPAANTTGTEPGIIHNKIAPNSYRTAGIIRSAAEYKFHPDLILMDFDLPDVDGRNLILALKKQLGGVNAPPIVAVTARTGSVEMKLAQSFGCSAFQSPACSPASLS